MALPQIYPVEAETPTDPGDNVAADDQQQQPHPLERLAEWEKSPNIAGDLEKDVLSAIAARVTDEYEIDKTSRADWEEEARLAMEAVLQKAEVKNYPFEKASNIKYPILTSAALQFGARTYPAIISGDKVVKVKTIGPDPMGLKQARADRVSLHMSYQLLKEMDGWEDGVDMLVHQAPVVGDAFKKVYRDVENDKNCSEMVPAMNVVVNQNTKSLDVVPRITHEISLYPYQIEERIRGGTFVKFDYLNSSSSNAPRPDGTLPSQTDDDAPIMFLEQHRFEDLDGDGMREPWVVTVHKDSGTVVRVIANFRVRKIRVRQDGVIVRIPKRDYFVHFPFLPDPNGGFYGIGFGRLLRAIGEAVNTSLNQIIDAAHLQNAGGGFIGSGLNLKKAELRIAMNEWKQLNVPGKNIRDAVVPHNFAGPSPVLFQVLGLLIDAGKQIASVQDVLTGDAHAQTMQPTTLLALIEQGLKVFTSIIKRMFRSLAREFRLLYELNQEYPDEEAYQRVIDWSPPAQVLAAVQQFQQQAAGMGHNGGPPMEGGRSPQADNGPMSPEGMGQPGPPAGDQMQQPGSGGGAPMPPQQLPPELAAHLERPTMLADYEYENCDIVPVADPTQVTDMQKMAKAQLIQELTPHPNMNKEEGLRRILSAANVEDIDNLIVPTPAGPDPIMVEGAKAEIELKRSGAMKNLAQADKLSIEGHSTMQADAAEHARMASGQADQEATLATAEQQHNMVLAERKQRLDERAQAMAEKQQQAAERGEAA